MIRYRDMLTGKSRRTAGTFARWYRGGLVVKTWYAVVKLPKSTLYIPYCELTRETKLALPELPSA